MAALACSAIGITIDAQAAPRVDFTRQILPLFQRACVSCHGPDKAQGGLQLGSAHRIRKGGIGDDLIVPGEPRKSYLVQRLRGEGDEERMPMKAPPLRAAELALVERWIAEGAVMPEEVAKFVPAPGGVKRLTTAQYHNTLRDLFGDKVALPTDLEPDTLVSGSATVGAARVALSGTGVEKYAAAAFVLARSAVAEPTFRTRYLGCQGSDEASDGASDGACLRGFIETFGLQAWRRPLHPDEVARYLSLGRASVGSAPMADPLDAGAVAITAAMLQSPHFLYRTEIGQPDPADPSRHRLTDVELASRLSYFLWAAPPDDRLLEAALGGKLATAAGLDEEARRLLRSPRARATMSAFFVELFRLRRLDRISENRTKYPQYSATLGASLRTETLRLIEDVAFAPERDFRDIFSSRFTYVNRELARLYGLPGPASDGFERVELPGSSGRAGVLGQGAFLTIFAHASSTSPTKRGKFIREALLCQAVPPPPPNVDTKLPKDEGNKVLTTRQKLEAHRNNTRCNGCHKAMDPLGVAFEPWDGIGAARANEDGLPIDASGELDGERFTNAAGLGALLARNPKIGACVARSLFRYAVGHLESQGEEPLLEELARGLERDGYRFEALVANVIKSEGFRTVAAPARASAPPTRTHAKAP